MKFKYWIRSWSLDIEKVELVKETAQTVWIKEIGNDARTIQYRKMSDAYKFFDTFEAAKNYMLDDCTKDIESLSERILAANRKMEKINKLVEGK